MTRIAVGVATALLLALPAAAAEPLLRPTPSATATTTPTVSALAVAGDRVYLGGNFFAAGRSTGGLLAVSRRNGGSRPFPRLSAGTAADIVADGRGGWIIGGDFVYVDGVECPYLAHIRRNGTLDRSWCPRPDALVEDLARSGSRLYVRGWFRRIRGQRRPGLALLDARSGRVRRWRPRFKVVGRILDVAARGSTLYLVGSFKTQGGVTRAGAAAIDERGRLARWNPRLAYAPDCTVSASSPNRCDPVVGAIAIADRTVYMSGFFERAGRAHRLGRVAVDDRIGRTRRWRSDIPGLSRFRSEDLEASLLVAHGRLYESMGALEALSLWTGKSLRWRPRLPTGDAEPEVLPLLAATPTGIVIAYVPYDGEADYSVAAEVDFRTGRRVRWQRRDLCCVAPLALAASGATVLLGGWFGVTDVSARWGLAALDRATGRFLPWRPRVRGYEIRALAVSGSVLYVGGDFSSVDGHPRQNLAAFDTRTGALLPWAPAAGSHPRAAVDTISATADAVYVGGTFELLAGAPRHDLGAVDPRTGAALPWNPAPDTSTEPGITSVVAAGETVYVGGLFRRIGGAARKSLAALDTTTGQATSWAPELDRPDGIGSVCGLAVGPLAVYAAGTFDSAGWDPGHRELAAFDRTTARLTAFDAKPKLSMTGSLCERDRNWIALELRGSTLFVAHTDYGGRFGVQASHHLSALDAETGRPLPWDPLPVRYASAGARVLGLASDDRRLFVGGSLGISGWTGFAAFDLANR